MSKSQINTPTPAAPPLHAVSDEKLVAIFDPERCSGDEEHWIQIDCGHAMLMEEWR